MCDVCIPWLGELWYFFPCGWGFQTASYFHLEILSCQSRLFRFALKKKLVFNMKLMSASSFEWNNLFRNLGVLYAMVIVGLLTKPTLKREHKTQSCYLVFPLSIWDMYWWVSTSEYKWLCFLFSHCRGTTLLGDILVYLNCCSALL